MQQAFPNASDFREQARKALKPNLSTAAMIMFLASLPGLISSAVRSIALTDPLNRVYQLLLNFMADSTVTEATLEANLMQVLTEASQDRMVILSGVLSVVVWLVVPFLSLGLIASLMKLLRGEAVAPADVLCRRGCFLKAIGLQLYVGLRELLWMVPGIAVMVLSVPVLYWLQNLSVFQLMYFGGLLLVLVLGLRAALHYSQAEMLMAEHPEARIRDCLHDSVMIMHHRKKYLVLLYCSFAGWMLLAYVLNSLTSGINTVLGLLCEMIVSLALNLYMNTAMTAFFLHYERQPDEM